MTKRSDEKELYLAALRGDAKAQRACTQRGKACGGRCIPKHWNCRIKGEGETPPTRGNAVQLSAEQKEKIQKARSRRRTRRALTAVGGAAAVGAAVAGAAALGAKPSAGFEVGVNLAVSKPWCCLRLVVRCCCRRRSKYGCRFQLVLDWMACPS